MRHTFIVAELGQNHNGNMDTARSLVDMAAAPVYDHRTNAKLPGVDAIKLCKRDLACELTAEAAAAPYPGLHSYGATYGAHRAQLELTVDQHQVLASYARERGLQVVETVCADTMVGPVVELVRPDWLKVASRDLTNHRLLEAMAATGVPTIVSTGMAELSDIRAALACWPETRQPAVLHCVSTYPAPYEVLNLSRIPTLATLFPESRVGYSDHSPGIMAPVAAVSLGATIVEKHITLDRQQRGTDHEPSLAPEGLWRLVRDIRNLEQALGRPGVYREPSSEPARRKLERSVATGPAGLAAGELVGEHNTRPLSPGTGVPWPARATLYGRKTRHAVAPLTHILPEALCAPE